mmetsp:Transcript_23378/g.34651  ORF Transcript_23378/g.34651 Transcript_23378/m.34651 type:complete len:646 (-) Transcript_23378:344-2281(-)
MFSTPEQTRRTRVVSTNNANSIMRSTPPPSPGSLYQRPESALIIPSSSHISEHSTHSALTAGSDRGGGQNQNNNQQSQQDTNNNNHDQQQQQNPEQQRATRHHHIPPPPTPGGATNAANTEDGGVFFPPPPPPAEYEIPIGSENTMNRTSSRHRSRKPPRLIERNMAFGQSANEVSIRHKRNIGLKKWLLLKNDWFHVLLRVETFPSLCGLLSIWTTIVMIFVGIYMGIDRSYAGTNCGLGQEGNYISFGAAFAFSLETATTVGYGLPGSSNAFFENCAWLQVFIYVQMVFAMMFNAFLFAFFFARLGKCEARGVQVVFSKKCLLSFNEQGKWCLQIRVHDADARYPIVEAHIRIYVKTKFSKELIPLRIAQPDDDMGTVCWVSYPRTIVHEIDTYSPLHPNAGTGGVLLSPFHLPRESIGSFRQSDGREGTLDQAVCPICGETFGTFDRLLKHVKYNQWCERRELGTSSFDDDDEDDKQEKENRPPLHIDINVEDIPSDEDDMPTKEDLLRNFPVEIIVLLEGIESLVSGTFQALQSYTRDDLVVGGRFADCVSIGTVNPFPKKRKIDPPYQRRRREWSNLLPFRKPRPPKPPKEMHVVDLLKFNQVLMGDDLADFHSYEGSDDDDEDISEEMVHPETASCRQM